MEMRSSPSLSGALVSWQSLCKASVQTRGAASVAASYGLVARLQTSCATLFGFYPLTATEVWSLLSCDSCSLCFFWLWKVSNAGRAPRRSSESKLAAQAAATSCWRDARRPAGARRHRLGRRRGRWASPAGERVLRRRGVDEKGERCSSQRTPSPHHGCWRGSMRGASAASGVLQAQRVWRLCCTD